MLFFYMSPSRFDMIALRSLSGCASDGCHLVRIQSLEITLGFGSIMYQVLSNIREGVDR